MRSGITFLAVLLIGLAACNPTGQGNDDRLRVVATTTQVGSIAAEIGGESIDLTVLLQPGAEAHDYEMTPADAAAIEEAELVLRSGAGLESWLDEALETIATDATLVDLSEGVELRESGEGEPAHEEEPGHTDEGEDHDVDPHYWLSGPNAIQMVRNAAAALSEASPADAAAFDERSSTLVGRLEAADAEVRSAMDAVPAERRGIVTNHDALGYFIEEYGLHFVGSVFPNLDVSSEPSPQELADLIETIRGAGVVAIFSDSAVNPELAETVAAETGATVVEEPLYTDSLGPPGSGAETLDGVLLNNARIIQAALTGS
jgi:zinc/manganese transport system substrate-binding protein